MAHPGIVFLMYHELEVPGRPLSQNEPGYVRYIVAQESFRAQMDWLARHGWRGLSTGQALAFPPSRSVAITFDDGCETDLLTAAPILKEHGFSATFYVTAGFLGKPGYMTPAQLMELSSLGFEVGCHSMTHPYLDDLERQDLQREIGDAGKELEDIIGRKVEHFACPGGRYNALVIERAREAKYRSFATSHAGVNSPTTDPFLLARVAVLRSLREATFGEVCAGKTLWRMRLNESVRSAAKQIMGNRMYDRLRTQLLRR